jgi:hypothetical protein
VSERLRDDKDIVLAAVVEVPQMLEYASVRLRDDKDIVLPAVTKNRGMLQYASERLRDIVLPH